MTEANTDTNAPQLATDDAPKPNGPLKPAGRWVKGALAVSLAINLAIAGLVAGAMLREGGPMQTRMITADLGFGSFTDALSKDDRAKLRTAFLTASPEMRDARRAMRADFSELLAKLREVPLDVEGLRSTFDRQTKRTSDRLKLGQQLIFDLMVGMTDDARQAFADRLEENLAKGPKHKDKPAGP